MATVVGLIGNTPAARVGFEPGDRLTKINYYPIQSAYQVESVRGWVVFEVINIRTGWPEWHWAYLP